MKEGLKADKEIGLESEMIGIDVEAWETIVIRFKKEPARTEE